MIYNLYYINNINYTFFIYVLYNIYIGRDREKDKKKRGTKKDKDRETINK